MTGVCLTETRETILDLLEGLLGRERNRANSLFDRFGRYSRWIFGCGCLLIVAIATGAALLIAGVVQLGEEAVPLALVAVVMIAAVVSLIRSQL